MIPGYHRLSTRAFRGLACGGGDAAAIRELASGQRSRTLLLLVAIVRTATRLGHPDAGLVEAAYRFLVDAQASAPVAVTAVLDYPTVGAWALHTTRLLTSDRPRLAHPGWLTAVAGAAAVRGGLDAGPPIAPLDPATGLLSLPTVGTATGVAGTASLDRHDWQPVPEVAVAHRGQRLVVRLDPLTGHSWADGGQPLAAPLTTDQIEEWRRRLAAGWRLLVENHPRVARETSGAISLIAPLREPSSGRVSSTFRNAFGGVAMSIPGDARQTALTLAHETAHVKLTGLMGLYPLFTELPAERFATPWRPDPRPLDALLHGTYAHLGVARFWRRQYQRETAPAQALAAHGEYVRWRDASAATARRLAGRPELSPLGRALVAGMTATLTAWQRAPGAE